ncbi:2-dehydropantoate 2-reductase (Ketopantoate reductase) (KPA reductase) (KPR) [Madurella fahalii]|uniref:2-dehydropantoate 2-reductase n=1 Tax=Madurella fahalii TaxID=1157608 RepID=A0ABQ0GEK8_9PEZI
MAGMTSVRSAHNVADNNDKTIYILGVGNLGKYAAHALAKHVPDQPVTLLLHRQGLLDDWKAAGEAIECIEAGLSSRTSGFGVEVLPASDILETDKNQNHPRPPIKHLIVATKAYNTTAALRRIRDRLSRGSNILFLQNGMGTTDEASATVFQDPASRPTYYAGICYVGIHSRPPFGFVHAGRGSLILGRVDTSDPTAPADKTDNVLLQSLSAAAPTLGTELATPTQLRVAQLNKLAINSTINPFSVILNCRNGHVFESETQMEALNQLLALETGPILRALLPARATADMHKKFQPDELVKLAVKVAEDTADNFSSMLQDVQAGRQTEIDYINGYLVKQGMEHGMETPQNAGIVEFVKQASRNKGPYDLDSNCLTGELRRIHMQRKASLGSPERKHSMGCVGEESNDQRPRRE